MRQKGKLVGGEKVAVGGVRHIRMRDGTPLSSNGPYAEAKDVIGGYFVIEAKDDAEADALARDCPHLWNATNWVELRPIDLMTAAGAPKARAIGWAARSIASSPRWRAIRPVGWCPRRRSGRARAASPSTRKVCSQH